MPRGGIEPPHGRFSVSSLAIWLPWHIGDFLATSCADSTISTGRKALTAGKGARWDSNPLHAEPQSAAYPLRLLAQYRSRESNPNQEIRSLLSYPLDHTGIVRVTGLEPATHGLKVHYLTTWLHAQDIMFKSPMFSFHANHFLLYFQI